MNSTRTFKAKAKPSAYEMRRELGYNWPGGVADTADRLAKKQNDGWTGSKSIHCTPEGRAKKRYKRLKRLERQAVGKAAK